MRLSKKCTCPTCKTSIAKGIKGLTLSTRQIKTLAPFAKVLLKEVINLRVCFFNPKKEMSSLHWMFGFLFIKIESPKKKYGLAMFWTSFHCMICLRHYMLLTPFRFGIRLLNKVFFLMVQTSNISGKTSYNKESKVGALIL